MFVCGHSVPHYHADNCYLPSAATPTVETVNFTAIRVTWVSMPSNIYVVQYGAVGGEYTIVDVGAVTGTQSSYVITGENTHTIHTQPYILSHTHTHTHTL